LDQDKIIEICARNLCPPLLKQYNVKLKVMNQSVFIGQNKVIEHELWRWRQRGRL